MSCAQDRAAGLVDMTPRVTREGERAKIDGLVSKPELNGKVVMIGPQEKSGR